MQILSVKGKFRIWNKIFLYQNQCSRKKGLEDIMITAADFDKRYDIVDEVTPRHTPMTGRYKKLVSSGSEK